MYLSSKEPDIVESPDTINTYKPSGSLKNKYSGKFVNGMLGVVMGKKIRFFKKKKMLQGAIGVK